jgi:hypothetical protein
MAIAEDIPLLNDCFIVSLAVEGSPSVEIPLTEVYDMVTSTLNDNYRAVIRETIVQILEDTMWINPTMMTIFLDATFSIFDIRDGGLTVSLRTAGLQRLVAQSIANRAIPIVDIKIPLLIKLKSPDIALPKPPGTPTQSIDTEGGLPASRSGPPSNVSETEVLDQVSELPGASPVLHLPRVATAPRADIGVSTVRAGIFVPGTESIEASRGDDVPLTRTLPREESDFTTTTGPTFRGNPVDINPDPSVNMNRGRDFISYDSRPPGGNPATSRRGRLFDHNPVRTPLLRTPTRAHPYIDEVTFGAETFEDYMSQFQYSEVKYKDFRKVVIPKFDASRNDSFVHWYKLLVSTCLQWGVWCPPYESVQEENIYGCWWTSLPQSVRNQQAFMGNLLYSLLIKPDTFPSNSRELEAVESSSANQGYHAIYNVLRLHHPILHSVYSTANQIPQQRRSETFGLYLRRLQEFLARERLATRTYTESEALDLAVRNLSSEWRNDFRRLVERDKRSGNGGTLPFKLALPQIATTFVEYASEIGREAPGSSHTNASRTNPTAIMRRLETDVSGDEESGAYLPDEDVDLIVNSIAQTQQASAVCIGCQQSGHTLTECNRFVDYIVAESLAQRHPTLRAQVANSHSHFRSRLNAVNARARLMQAPPSSRAIRSLQMVQDEIHPDHDPPSPSDPTTTVDIESSDDHGYRQHSINIADDDPTDDFEECFTSLSIQSVHVLGVDDASPISAETIHLPSLPTENPYVIRRLAETYDASTTSVYAHADNGSMACTVNDAKLLFAYRTLVGSKVRLFDAGDHVHRPLGVGFLCVPTDNHASGGAQQFVFVRTYHTPTIPGVIISHSAISKQLKTSSYHMSSHSDNPGFIHFPHALRRCQDTYVSLQPTSQRGGLTFTKALILPTDEEHLASLPPWPTRVLRLCSDHSESLQSIIDPTDGMTCQACHESPDMSNSKPCPGCRPMSATPDFR